MKLFRMLFPSKNYKKLKAKLEEFKPNFYRTSYKIVKDDIEKNIFTRENFREIDFRFKESSDDDIVVLKLFLNVIEYELSSGSHHLYAGILLPVGKELHEMYLECVKMILEKDGMTESEAKKRKKDLWWRIQEIG